MDFFPLFGGSRIEETGKENPVAGSQFLKLLFLSSSLKIALLTDSDSSEHNEDDRTRCCAFL